MVANKTNPSLTLLCNGKLLSLDRPLVMGIVNFTPDSFFAGSRWNISEIQQADIVDIGGCSTRPNSTPATAQEEQERLEEGIKIIREHAPEAIISVDTYRPEIARWALQEHHVDIINDISGGCPEMMQVVGEFHVPYILTYPEAGPSEKMLYYFSEKIAQLEALGVADIILDPGFGFGKTLEENYEIARHMSCLKTFNLPILVGISRKSMIQKLVGVNADNALNGTTALNAFLLEQGAHILRVHDVQQAQELVSIYQQFHPTLC